MVKIKGVELGYGTRAASSESLGGEDLQKRRPNPHFLDVSSHQFVF